MSEHEFQEEHLVVKNNKLYHRTFFFEAVAGGMLLVHKKRCAYNSSIMGTWECINPVLIGME